MTANSTHRYVNKDGSKTPDTELSAKGLFRKIHRIMSFDGICINTELSALKCQDLLFMLGTC